MHARSQAQPLGDHPLSAKRDVLVLARLETLAMAEAVADALTAVVAAWKEERKKKAAGDAEGDHPSG